MKTGVLPALFIIALTLPGCAKPSQVKLFCAPQVAKARMFKPAAIHATVRVTRPGEQLWCPGIRWTVEQNDAGFRGLGLVLYRGAHESDCLPYAEIVAEEGEIEQWSETKDFGLFTGSYIICADLYKAGKRIGSDSCIVSVH